MNFNVTTPDGRKVPFTCNDVIFDYTSYRKIFSEQDCLSLIDSIKTKSGKKVAIVFGNCQTMNINDFLLNNVQFTNEYFIVKIPAICNYIEEGFSFVKDEIIRGGGYSAFVICSLVNILVKVTNSVNFFPHNV